jgi:heat shock protein beta
VFEWEVVNEQKAIWTRARKDVTTEEYNNFYKSITKESDDPLTFMHFTAEGEIEFRSILYVPGKARSDAFEEYYGKSSSLRLYVRKVLIADEFEDLMPRYLSFIRGVVDSDDLPLNVSRETLQQHKVLKVMSKKLVRKALEMLRKLAQKGKKGAADEAGAEEEEGEDKVDGEEGSNDYDKFWEQFGKNIKLGIIEDASNRTKLSKLLRFKSSKSDGKWVSLEDFVGRMKEWQKSIFYVAGESLEAVESMPFLDKFKAKDVEVLFLVDPVDEYAIQNLTEFDGKKLQSITKEGVKFGDETDSDKKLDKLYTEKFSKLVSFLKDVYGDRVEKVQVSKSLGNVPSLLVTAQYGYSANMERIMKSQAFSDQAKMQHMVSKRTMEINPRHPIVIELASRVAENAEAQETKDTANLLYDTAVLNSGFSMDDPKEFAGRMYRLMQAGLNIESLELAAEAEVPADEPEEPEEEEADEGEEDGEDADADEL